MWARLRLILVFTAVDLSAMGMADYFEITTVLRMWNDIVLPTILLVVSIIVFMRILRDILETDTSGQEIFIHFLFLILFFVEWSWLEGKIVAKFNITGSSIGYYLSAPLAAVTLAVSIAAKYIQDIYNLESYSLALLYILASFWGIAYPRVIIDDGQYKIEPGKVNRLERIGGPGHFTVRPGTAVILNDVGVASKVVSSNKFFLSHYGSIVSIVDLNNQRILVPTVTATTKDGITITIRDIEMRYRIWSPSAVSDPYPYTDQSVLDRVYNLSVNEKGLSDWTESVKGIVVGQITGYITKRQFDEIVTPTFHKHEPRQEIRRELFSPATEERLNGIGARLLWCDIGHFETDKAVLDQRLETWSAKWIGNASVVRAQGEAKRIAYQELGRAEGQADILMGIIRAFGDIDLSMEKKNQNIRSLIFMRSAQVLDALTGTRPQEVTKRLSGSDALGDGKNKEERQS